MWRNAIFHEAKDVFEDHNGIVNQSGKGQRQSPKKHGVDGTADAAHHQKAHQGGKRNGKQNGKGGARAAKEQQNHNRREDQPDPALFDEIADGQFDEDGLVEDYLSLEDGGNIDEMFEGGPHAIDDRDGITIAALLEDGNVYGALAIDAHNVGLNGAGVFCVSDIRDKNRAQTDGFERNAIDFFRGGQLAVGIDVVITIANLYVAGGKNQVRIVYRVHYVHQAELVCFEFEGIDKDLNLTIRTPKRLRNGGTLHIGDLIAHGELGQVFELRLIETLALESDKANWEARRVEFQDYGR